MRTVPTLMTEGAGFSVGKPLVEAGLRQAARRRGLSVAPFRPQTMSNDDAMTEDGGEIGRAQALWALACGRPPTVLMNPVLLKPEIDVGAQTVVQGRRPTRTRAGDDRALKSA